MFITRGEFKSPTSSFLLEDGETEWSAIELPQQQTWFLVHFGKIKANHDSEFAWSNTIFLFDFLSVEHFIQTSHDSNMRLISAHIVTPAHVNGSGTWKMEQLRAVWQSEESIQERTSPMNIFETVSGEMYYASSTGWHRKNTATDTLKFEFAKTSRTDGLHLSHSLSTHYAC